MNDVTGKRSDWMAHAVTTNIEADLSRTFSLDAEVCDLQVRRSFRSPADDEEGNERIVSSKNEVNDLFKASNTCQLYYISQRHSFSRLRITRDLFDHLINTYGIFDRIFDFVSAFGFKTRDTGSCSDIGTATFKFQQNEPLIRDDGKLGSFECAYGFRYVELNHRAPDGMVSQVDHSPWSIRQTAIYQQHSSAQSRLMIIAIAPSQAMKESLEKAICQATANNAILNVFDLNRIITSTLQDNWRHYIRYLEQRLVEQSDSVLLSKVQSTEENPFPVARDTTVRFLDRQRLTHLEDKILDLITVLESLFNTLSSLKHQSLTHCMQNSCWNCRCAAITEELGVQMYDVEILMKKVDVLYKRAQAKARLLSDLLEYDNAQIAHVNSRSLSGLTKESKDENFKMRLLTERSARDAAAVKILTVITLFYLPMTVVASIFSSQLIRVSDSGRVSVVSGSWWFVVVSAPLTVGTFLLWRYFVHRSLNSDEARSKFTDPLIGKHYCSTAIA